jgi:uncharacterized membrane protein (UPF0127 family)
MLFKKKDPVQFKKWHGVVLGIIVIVCIGLRYWPHKISLKHTMIELSGQQLSVLIADTLPTQIEGLSDRDTIKPYDGMLFLFKDKTSQTFVMRRMRFPLDMLWIDGDTIVDVAPNLPLEPEHSEAELNRYTGRSPADKVLELPAGFIDKYQVKIGDKISTISK